ncbi:MAG: tRNA uridine-5-carboxymethylaminomethyl(34) synthesis GTPase MnmE [Flavobacteriales bacterium]|nr:tRNA uridine-5-carboxymethylaminomethyl(34) synthesis GTPase MnmE [Flavobacteriales bacterium]
MSYLRDTICAVSTPPGIGGIAVIRISGPASFSITDKVCSQDVISQSHMSMSFGKIFQEGEILDEVIISKFEGPRSFTGEDVIEISCHGSEYIQASVLKLLIEAGCRMASNGEFTKRAFLNGKLDLSQAEAVADLIASESEASHRVAMQQMKGGVSNEISQLRTKLMEFASLLELELDFSEEDVEFADREDFTRLIKTILEKVDSLLDSFQLGNVIKKGIPVAIIGAPNSGKSTLLNALLNEERAIVSDIAGTTRDAIEDTVNIGGFVFRFIDTAGVRSTKDAIERKGISIALEKAKYAAIVIKLMDGRQEILDPEERLYTNYFEQVDWRDDDRTITVLNKIDILGAEQNFPSEWIGISALNREGLDELKDRLLEKLNLEGLEQNNIILTSSRHIDALSKVKDSLQIVLDSMSMNIPSDLIAIDVKKALHYLGEVTGEVTTDDILGTIFSKFCIGK